MCYFNAEKQLYCNFFPTFALKMKLTLNQIKTMNTKKSFLALAAIACFALTSCTSSSSADDALYENDSVDKTKLKIPNVGVDKTKLKIPSAG